MAVRVLWFTFVREDRDGTRWCRKWDTEKASLHSSTTMAIKAQKYLTKDMLQVRQEQAHVAPFAHRARRHHQVGWAELIRTLGPVSGFYHNKHELIVLSRNPV